ncbi:unnamed protein product [Amoebophrya sp. A25]|nr:unnamed protein product [Amoebophrya sp. A25]|eukprot:GSA25T00020584001.1
MRVLATTTALAGVAYGSEKSRPVSKVIKLLKDMQAQMEAEAEEDESTFKKMGCWCDTTKAETEEAIATDKKCIAKATADIEQATGAKAAAKTAKADLEERIQKDTQDLETATEMRAKELAEFTAEEKEMVQAIGALKSAVTVLKKHNSFLQTDSKFKDVRNTLMTNMELFERRHLGEISSQQKKTLSKFLQQPSFSAYSSQSGEIFGILENMLDTFNADLKQAREDEGAAVKQFAELKKLKEEQIARDSAQLKKENQKYAAATTKLADSEATKAECEDSLEKDTTLLNETVETCTQNDQEFSERTKSRNEELEGVAKALEFLNSDEAHDLFGRSLGFLQVTSSSVDQARAVLRSAGQKYNNPEILSLAQKVKSDAFAPVIHAIDDLVKDIKKTMADDVAQKDTCTTEINERTKTVTKLDNEITNLSAEMDRLDAAITTLTENIEQTAAEIAEAEEQLNKASQLRQQANADFQVALKDEKDSVGVLKKAEQVLAKVYAPKLLQQSPTFKTYEQNQGGNKVLSMIATIIADTEKSAELRIAEEKAAQKEYEKFVKNSNDSIKDKKALKAQLTEEKASSEEKLQETTDKKKFTTDSHTAETAALDQWKSDCKFLFDNFEIRQEHMSGEIDALNEAKAFLKGMKLD